LKSKYWKAPSKETEKLVERKRREGYTPLPPEICAAIRRYVRKEFRIKRFAMHLVDDGASRDYTSYIALPLSREINAEDHMDLYSSQMLDSRNLGRK
jgi:hypothetical protein